jgi:TonB family protein
VFIAGMHRKIHELWGFGFLEELDGKSSGHELNDWELATRLEIAVNPDGTIHKINIVKPSGVLMFDVAAIDAVLTGEPYEAPPDKIRSVDGRAWMHWDFHRDWRQCGTFGVQPFILSDVSEKGDSLDDSDLARRVPRKGTDKREVEMPTAEAPAGDPGASARANAQMPAPDDPKAKHAANLWLTGFTKNDLVKMTSVSGIPFRSGGDIVANSPGEVSAVWKIVVSETKRRVISDWKLLSPAQYRKVFGSIPAGIEPNHVLMVVQVPGEQFTLVLSQDGAGEYKVVAFNR